jgi:perosamine synthetase
MMRIPLSAPDISETEIAAVTSVLRTPWLSRGPMIEEFERALAEYLGVPHAVAVSSGTAGLHLALRALGIGAGDEVIVPSFAFISVAHAVEYVGAVPVFVEIEPEGLGLDPASVEAAIGPKTRAILLVHTFGCPGRLEEILPLARRRSLILIEDACEALGAELSGKKAGSFGEAGVFAFYPNKQITTGEGGAVVVRDTALARRLRMLRNQGCDPSLDWLQNVELGYNYRLPELSCALGVEQLKRIEPILARRAAVASGYARRLAGDPRLELPPASPSDRRISWFTYSLRLKDGADACVRDQIYHHLIASGIGCGRYFVPIHLQPAYQRLPHRAASLPLSESIAARSLALPFFNRITEVQLDEVCRALTEALGEEEA